MTLNEDWLFETENKIYNFRGCGVLLNNNKILIQRGEKDSEFALPGGQVKFGETSAETVVREYKEELGFNVSVDRMIWIDETFWKWGSRDCHTICHYHLIHLTEGNYSSQEGTFKSLVTDESRLLFQWIHINKLSNIKIYPSFLAEKIINISQGIDHFVSRE